MSQRAGVRTQADANGVLPPVGERKPVESVAGIPAEHGSRCDIGVHAAVSWTYMGCERAEESLLRIRRALKEPRGWWGPDDEAQYREVVGD